MTGKTFADVIKGLPQYKIVFRPAQTIEETRDPSTIYGPHSLGDISNEVITRARSAGLLKE